MSTVIKQIRHPYITRNKKTRISKHKINKWKILGEKVSSKWDNISAIEEINQQREKQ
jgi:hypothetical protein